MKKFNPKKLLTGALAFMMAFTMFPATVAHAAEPRPDYGTLVIHKYIMDELPDEATGDRADGTEKTITGATPLDGVEFEIYDDGGKLMGTITTGDDRSKVTDADNAEWGGAGTGVAGITLPAGTYTVKEIANAQSITVVEPFTVDVPMTNPAGDGWLTTVHVYPKNESAKINKWVGGSLANNGGYYFIGPEGKHLGVDTHGGEIQWHVQADIPAGVQTEDVYEIRTKITDQTLVNDSVRVFVGDGKFGNPFQMEFNVKTTEAKGDVGCYIDGDELVISFSADDIKRFPYGVDSLQVDVYYRTTLNSNVTPNVALESPAKLTIKNNDTSNNTLSTTEANVEDIPEVHTGIIKITKLDASDKTTPLENAEFCFALNEKDANEGVFITDAAGEVIVAKTNDKGVVTISGFAYGYLGDLYNQDSVNTTIWVVEIKAPEGYNLLPEPFEMNVSIEKDAVSFNFIAEAEVLNSNKLVLPVTGSTGTWLFIGFGAMALIGAAYLVLSGKKKGRTVA